MPTNPKKNLEKLERIENAWKTLAPNKEFGGMTLTQFTEFVNASRDARNVITNLENQINDAINLRDNNDKVALNKRQLVKNSVLGDPTEGDNSALYEGMGYIRKDNKKSGLTRKRKDGNNTTE